ncbi:phosphodiester glycosidase family protein [Flavobacterium sp.]|uniref:phosphodiester glycosidase family protein n=1 Tax=Flavobacterium sp. TaxID=239 RepID=UPI0037526E30
MKNIFSLALLSVLTLATIIHYKLNSDYIEYTVNPKKASVCMYFKNEKEINYGSLNNLKLELKKNNKELLFAMNGGMYKKDKSPQGLFIENKIYKSSIDTASGTGNFYLKPNGIFFLTIDDKAKICKTQDFIYTNNVKYATQSGPMLVIDGEINTIFNEKSTNLNVRNGVGILPNNEIIFAMSKDEVNFYEFAHFFQKKGCKNALYLDGFVSRTYCLEQKWMQTDGDFGVIIGVTKK